MVRRVLSVFAGLLAGYLVVALIEGISNGLYPPPSGVDMSDIDALRAHIATLPPQAFMIVWIAHVVGALVAGFVCVAISSEMWRTGPLILGILLLGAGVTNLVLIPHPVWFSIADALAYVPSALAGGYLALRFVSAEQ